MEFKATVDRIENEVAVLLVRPDETFKVDWPLYLLPPGVKEGDVISCNMEIDEEETTKSKEKVSNLLNKLLNKDNSKRQ